MRIFTFLGKHLFWVLQILGWGIIFFFIGYAAFIDGNSLFDTTLISSSIFIAGVITTSIYRWLLKRYSTLEFNLKNISRVIGLAFVCCMLWVLILYLFKHFIVLDHAGSGSETHKEHEGIAITLGPMILGLALLSVWTLLYYIVKSLRNHNQNRIERLQLRESIKNAQLNILQGHVNGKFLIKVLHSIRKQMPLDTKNARKMLTDLSELLRYSLSNQNVKSISISHEMDMVQKYLELYQIDAPNTIKLSNEMNSEFLDNTVPPMLLISMFELMLDDAVVNGANKRELRLYCENLDDNMVLGLHTSGVLNTGLKEDTGFKKVNQRLRLLYGKGGTLSIIKEQKLIKLYIPRYQNRTEEK
ncbi:sensor histidine kinase [Zobellia alginiliquefaciens]|uniref:sensor histidine kinase n=1 Tax=Zobellia alginiliquefaciens TaxID=3032586 RepID=UPI0023E37B3C|nr:histidine kinase [Zobellia alginiliquefaciens]